MKVARDFIFDPGLVLYLPLYELDGASFMSGDAYGHLATVTGALWTPRGRDFDGVDDVITFPSHDSLNITTGDLSIVAWVKRSTGGTADAIVGGSTLDAPEFEIVSTGVVHFAKPSTAETTADSTITNSIWSMLAVTFDNSEAINNVVHYLNGQPDGVKTLNVDFADYIRSIGAGNNGSTWWFEGTIGEMLIYNRILSAPEISRLYQVTRWRYQ